MFLPAILSGLSYTQIPDFDSVLQDISNFKCFKDGYDTNYACECNNPLKKIEIRIIH